MALYSKSGFGHLNGTAVKWHLIELCMGIDDGAFVNGITVTQSACAP